MNKNAPDKERGNEVQAQATAEEPVLGSSACGPTKRKQGRQQLPYASTLNKDLASWQLRSPTAAPRYKGGGSLPPSRLPATLIRSCLRSDLSSHLGAHLALSFASLHIRFDHNHPHITLIFSLPIPFLHWPRLLYRSPRALSLSSPSLPTLNCLSNTTTTWPIPLLTMKLAVGHRYVFLLHLVSEGPS